MTDRLKDWRTSLITYDFYFMGNTKTVYDIYKFNKAYFAIQHFYDRQNPKEREIKLVYCEFLCEVVKD